MSLRESSVYGVRDLDDGKFASMLRAKIACESAGIAYPPELREYFKGEPECDEDHLRREMEEEHLWRGEDLLSTYDSTDVVEIDLSKVPKEFTKLRISISY